MRLQLHCAARRVLEAEPLLAYVISDNGIVARVVVAELLTLAQRPVVGFEHWQLY